MERVDFRRGEMLVKNGESMCGVVQGGTWNSKENLVLILTEGKTSIEGLEAGPMNRVDKGKMIHTGGETFNSKEKQILIREKHNIVNDGVKADLIKEQNPRTDLWYLGAMFEDEKWSSTEIKNLTSAEVTSVKPDTTPPATHFGVSSSNSLELVPDIPLNESLNTEHQSGLYTSMDSMEGQLDISTAMEEEVGASMAMEEQKDLNVLDKEDWLGITTAIETEDQLSLKVPDEMALDEHAPWSPNNLIDGLSNFEVSADAIPYDLEDRLEHDHLDNQFDYLDCYLWRFNDSW
ncbi:hypothetical protein R1flu_002321 [Riccia fluitans]|uniref:Uncharacterized protein n=1 Tax=Riccia fluitans TaxID=41844 RepID=A0ABD1Y5R1_9MARC